jgi:formylglycine-generating enzyme required for sulfatase activity
MGDLALDGGATSSSSTGCARIAHPRLVFDDDGGEEGVALTTVVARSVPSVVPVAPVSFYQGAAACAAAGKRLCAPAEWLWACENGTATNTYPYGDTFDGAGHSEAHETTCGSVTELSPHDSSYGGTGLRCCSGT